MTAVVAAPSSSSPEKPAPSSRVRWLRRGLYFFTILAAPWVFRAPLLRTVSAILIVRSAPTPVDVVIIVDGAAAFEEATRRLASAPSAELWLFEREPNRLQRRGILPSTLECVREACQSAGIPEQRIRVQPYPITGTRGMLDELDRLLVQQPQLRVGLIAEEWNSRWLSGQVQNRVSPAMRTNVIVIPVAHPTVSRGTWWHTKPGRLRVAEAVLKLTADWLIADRANGELPVSDDVLRQAGLPP